MSWQGNPNNNPPNNVELPDSVSELNIGENRAFNTRRDTDTVKNPTVTLEDIDSTIITHLRDYISPTVVTNGDTRVKVPVIYGSPERWKSAQIDGVFKDYNGKIQAPVIVIKRSSFTKNENLMTLNRHLQFPVMTRYTEKNKYDKFSLLTKAVVPVNSIYMVTLPDHIKITYDIMVWTDLVEQLNGIIEKINFATEDYWGDKKRYQFRVYANDYSTPIEVEDGDDRLVRCELSLTVMGYLLPDSFEDRKLTTQKMLTPRQVIVTSEVDSKNPNGNGNDKKNKTVYKDNFIELAEEAPHLNPPKISFGGDVAPVVTLQKIQNAYSNLISVTDIGNSGGTSTVWHFPPPVNATDPGQEGWMSYDSNFHYIYVNGVWKRQALTGFTQF